MKGTDFRIGNIQFTFVNRFVSGAEEIYAADELLSSQKGSMFGKTHSFEYEGDTYEIRVKPALAGVTFVASKNGEREEVELQHRKVPPRRTAWFLILGPIITSLVQVPMLLSRANGGYGLGGLIGWVVGCFVSMCIGIVILMREQNRTDENSNMGLTPDEES